MSLDNLVHEAARRGAEIRIEHLEMLTAAYFSKTDIPPDQVVLVEEHQATKTIWYFARKDAPLPVSDKDERITALEQEVELLRKLLFLEESGGRT